SQPLTSGVGIKDGDMWFKTNENNKMFILTKGVWKLADDALDKVNTGRIVLNGNTTVNGDFKVSAGNNVRFESNVNVYGGGNGITVNNGANEASSTKQTSLIGGALVHREKNGNGHFVETTVIRKVAMGSANDGTVINLRDYSSGISWNNPSVFVVPSMLTVGDTVNGINASAEKQSGDLFKINAYSTSLKVTDFTTKEKRNIDTPAENGYYESNFTLNNVFGYSCEFNVWNINGATGNPVNGWTVEVHVRTVRAVDGSDSGYVRVMRETGSVGSTNGGSAYVSAKILKSSHNVYVSVKVWSGSRYGSGSTAAKTCACGRVVFDMKQSIISATTYLGGSAVWFAIEQ
ncbi:MAG: hypothetical protein ACRC0G_00160, partial [Fusobacteriaceae bacterium]